MSMMRKRVIAIIAAALAIVILGVSLAAVLEYVDTIEFVDVDGTKYYAKNKDGVYKLYAKGSKEPLPVDGTYGYYVTALGTLVNLDAETGEAKEYIPVITEGNENVGFNDRVLMFPHIEKKNILSLEVHNEHGAYTFKRMKEENGSLVASADGNFIIENSPLTAFNEELFAELYVGAGYALTILKIKDPIKRTADGSLCPHKTEVDGQVIIAEGCDCVFSEYGLVPEKRIRDVIDEETGEPVTDKETGNTKTEVYDYTPAYYILTDIKGNRYKVIVGDMLVTGGGYYVQYVDISGAEEVKRDAVYVMDTSSGNALLSPIENYVTPMLSYPMSMNSYFDVENFLIVDRKTNEYKGGEELTDLYNKVISFSYIDLSERENTMSASTPYEFEFGLDGYNASDTAINSCLYNIYSPALTKTLKFKPTDKDLIDYGFFVEQKDKDGKVVTNEKGETQYETFSKNIITYKYDVPKEEGSSYSQTVEQIILISDKDYEKTGKYYTLTMETLVIKDKDGKVISEETYTYDFIVEAEGYTFDFLKWDKYEWVNPGYVDANIAFVQSIKLTSPYYSAEYILDNSKTTQSDSISSLMLGVTATENGGTPRKTFDRYDVLDVRSSVTYHWVITSNDIKVYKVNADGTETSQKINNDYAYYDYNDLDNQVLCRNGRICGYDTATGERVEVEVIANYVNIYTSADGNFETNDGVLSKSMLRYDTDLFRKFYQTLLYGSLEGSYVLSDEEEKAITEAENGLLLTIEIKLKDAESAGGKESTNVYKFYMIPGSSRKAYITVNGNGGFYVYRTKVDKFISDSQKFFKNEVIVPDTKR